MYFKNFPTISYNSKKTKNIILRGKIIDSVFKKFDTFHPYEIQDGERPDTIAHDYYGNSAYDWVVLQSNGIVDPVYEWPLTYHQFIDYLKVKYEKNADLLKSEILHYKYTGTGADTANDIARDTWLVTPTTYSYMSASEKAGWTSVTVYDYEEEENEAKRNIQLLDRTYIEQINSELGLLF